MSENVQPDVVHETSTWLVLNKPAGWHTVGPGKKRAQELAMEKTRGGCRRGDLCPGLAADVERWLRSQPQFAWARSLDEAGIVHRLDFETSGCLLVAKTADEQRRLRAAFQSGEGVQKTYLAIVASAPRHGIADRGDFRFYFTSRHKRSKKVTVRNEGDPKHEGRCSWRLIEHAAMKSPRGDLIEIELHGPGRRHQVRAGFAALGHPILGDTIYGGPEYSQGLTLHAWKLMIESVAIECARPSWK